MAPSWGLDSRPAFEVIAIAALLVVIGLGGAIALEHVLGPAGALLGAVAPVALVVGWRLR
jgi:hypothetical protein